MDRLPEWLFSWWQRFFDEIPFGPDNANLMLARICSTIAVTSGAKLSEKRFMPGAARRGDEDDE